MAVSEEAKGIKRRVTRTDPTTGVSREFEEWSEYSRSISNPEVLKESLELREALWEMEDTASRPESRALHAKMLKRLKVTPPRGMRAPTV